MTALLAGPTSTEAGDRQISTAIPDGTTLLGVSAQERRGDGRPLDRVRLGRWVGVDAVPARPGRLHADPVQHHQVGRLPDRRRDRDRLRRRGDRPRRPGRTRRLHRPSCRRSSSTGRHSGRPSRPRAASPAMPTCSRRPSGWRSSTRPASCSRTSRSWPPAGPAAAARSARPSAMRSARPSGARCVPTNRQPRTGHP